MNSEGSWMKWTVKWMADSAEYKMTFQEGVDFKIFVKSRNECFIPNVHEKKTIEALPNKIHNFTSTPKNLSQDIANSGHLKNDLDEIFDSIIESINNAFSEAIPSIINAVEKQKGHRYGQHYLSEYSFIHSFHFMIK